MQKSKSSIQVLVPDSELATVTGGSIWGAIKKIGRWIKKHVSGNKDGVVVKGTHDIGGG